MRCTPGDRCTLGSADLSGRESYERNQSDGPVLRVIRATAAKGGRTFEEEAEIDLVAVRNERVQLKSELQTLEAEMEGYLKELGYGA